MKFVFKRNTFVCFTFIVSLLLHVPLYSWAASFYFPVVLSKEAKEAEIPVFRYVVPERKVIISRSSDKYHLKKSTLKSKGQFVKKEGKKTKSNLKNSLLKETVKKKLTKNKKALQALVLEKKIRAMSDDVELQNEDVKEAFINYYQLLSDIISRFAVYPSSAKNSNLEGVVYVSFAINRQGRVVSITLRRSSGNASLDSSAIMAVRNAAPFPDLPEEIKQNTISLNVPISYEV